MFYDVWGVHAVERLISLSGALHCSVWNGHESRSRGVRILEQRDLCLLGILFFLERDWLIWKNVIVANCILSGQPCTYCIYYCIYLSKDVLGVFSWRIRRNQGVERRGTGHPCLQRSGFGDGLGQHQEQWLPMPSRFCLVFVSRYLPLRS